MNRPAASGPVGAPAPARARKTYLLRAGVAALASAVLALWLLSDKQASEPDREAPAMSAAPNDSAPSVPAASPTEPESAVPPASATDDANVPPAVEGHPAAEAGVGEVPAAGSAAPSDTAAPPPAAAAVPAAPSAPPAAEQSAAPTVPATKGDRTAGAGEAAPPPGRGYMVQLGVFAAPTNAQRLRDELVAQGYPAHMQSRVVMGPFPDRQAAEAAHAKVRSEHRIDGVIVPPRKR
jgi:DedD protein